MLENLRESQVAAGWARGQPWDGARRCPSRVRCLGAGEAAGQAAEPRGLGGNGANRKQKGAHPPGTDSCSEKAIWTLTVSESDPGPRGSIRCPRPSRKARLRVQMVSKRGVTQPVKHYTRYNFPT